ncbi:MAG: histidine--tRNA ligase [Actinobacteria bacterium]|nr:histidine--tRNA ligase [Actinomycetota bacterium]
MIYNSPRGTSDYFGESIKYIDFIIKTSKDLFKLYNYSEIITPHFEYTEVFSRGIGENSDIVKKEMYTFLDKKGRSLTLRPEGTASVVRAVVERKLYSENLPLKLFYIGNMFRYEKPQKGRMREFKQIGIEAIGSDNPAIDAEAIWLLHNLFDNLGFKNLVLYINSIGCSECRRNYIKLLEEYLKPYNEQLCDDCKNRIGKNTLRVFDCKIQTCKNILANAPKISNYLCESCRKHLKDVFSILDILDIKYVHNENLVRGFDYYTRTIFEIISKDIDSTQNALGGGGRYDYLIKEFGGPELSSIGFAIGLERTMLLMQELGIRLKEDENNLLSAYLISMSNEFNSYIFKILKFLRKNKIICDSNFNIKNISKEIKFAKLNGYSHILIIGEDEFNNNLITIKDLNNYTQMKISWLDEKNKLLNLFKNPDYK